MAESELPRGDETSVDESEFEDALDEMAWMSWAEGQEFWGEVFWT